MIFVFKTSVATKHEVRVLKPLFDSLLAREQWNFDLDDCDRILRVDCEESSAIKIIDLLSSHKFTCEELEDK
jgi:hypothetical protein